MSKQVQEGRGHQQGRRRRRERRCRLAQPTCPLRCATGHKRASTSMCQVEVVDNLCLGIAFLEYLIIMELGRIFVRTNLQN